MKLGTILLKYVNVLWTFGRAHAQFRNIKNTGLERRNCFIQSILWGKYSLVQNTGTSFFLLAMEAILSTFTFGTFINIQVSAPHFLHTPKKVLALINMILSFLYLSPYMPDT